MTSWTTQVLSRCLQGLLNAIGEEEEVENLAELALAEVRVFPEEEMEVG